MPDEQGFSEFRAFLMFVGYVVINWAVVERHVDNIVSVAYIQCGGEKYFQGKGAPRAFGMKNRFLKTCFQEIDALASLKERGMDLMRRSARIAKLRNDLVHGTLSSIHPTNGAFHFETLTPQTKRGVKSYSFSITDCEALQKELEGLAADIPKFSDDLATIFLTPK